MKLASTVPMEDPTTLRKLLDATCFRHSDYRYSPYKSGFSSYLAASATQTTVTPSVSRVFPLIWLIPPLRLSLLPL